MSRVRFESNLNAACTGSRLLSENRALISVIEEFTADSIIGLKLVSKSVTSIELEAAT